jgi:soluble lytic murein transglycosylase-like protein
MCDLRRAVRVASVLLSATLNAPLMAQVYTGGDAAGTSVVLSNFRSDDAPQLLIAAPPAALDPTATPEPRKALPVLTLQLPSAPIEVRHVIDDVAAKVGISAELLHAVIATESRYNSRALSHRGAMGLMQLMPATAKRFGAQNPYAPHDNVLAGATYLKWLMAMFRGDLELVLAAYNAGEQAVVKSGGRIPPFAETQAYVPRVLAYLRCASSAACRPA